MRGIRALLVDFGATLDGTSHWLDRFVEHYRRCGLQLRRDELDPAFSFATAEGYRRTAELRLLGYRDLIEKLALFQLSYLAEHGGARLQPSLSSTDASARARLASAVADDFWAKSAQALNESRDILSWFAPRTRLGVVSNFYGNLEVVLAEVDILPLVGAVVDSSVVGFSKPDSRIFELAVKRLEVAPSETVMVGDSWEKDCVAAVSAGLRAVWLHPNGGAALAADKAPGQSLLYASSSFQSAGIVKIQALNEIERVIS